MGELRNRMAAVESRERVILTVRADPVADVPHGSRARWLGGERLVHELAGRAAGLRLS